MLNVLNNKNIIIISTVITLLMFVIVMFIVNPSIDGKNGMGVLALQLVFDKELGIEIINSWGKLGIDNFNQLIFTDYIYALGYSVLFSSILSVLILRKAKENYNLIIYLPFVAGLFDWIENTIELFFINNPIEFSSSIFFIHSIVASLKWLTLPIIVSVIIKLGVLKDIEL